MKPTRPGFTLIELLIVVAIIAVLAAIAVPNFMEAQTRAKTSRVRADHRSLATALEAYVVDQGQYPQCVNNGWPRWIVQLSTPVAYITPAQHFDPYLNYRGPVEQRRHPYLYYGFNEEQVLSTHSDDHPAGVGRLYLSSEPVGGSRRILWWLLMSVGPDQERNNNGSGTLVARVNLIDPKKFVGFLYDPSNGTVSSGDIIRTGGGMEGESSRGLQAVK